MIGAMAVLRLASCGIDLESGLISPSGERLAPRELALLRYLAERPSKAVDRAELLQRAFGYAPKVQSRAADKAMLTLRKKLERDPSSPEHLLTDERAGYRFEPLRGPSPAERPLVGRQELCSRALQILSRPVCLTLHGPGGVGKTALAAEVARAYSEGGRPALSCRAERCQSEQDMLSEIASALRLDPDRGGLSQERITSALLARGDALLLIDGCEALPSCAALVGAIARVARELRILVTSRVPLGLSGEIVLPVAPLPLDDAALLLSRRAAERGVQIQSDTLAPLAARLDGLPLCLELAAPWLVLFSPEALASRLASPLDLPGASGDALRRVIARSEALLDEDQRATARALSIFRVPFTVEMAEAALPDRPALPEILAALCARSLLSTSLSRASVRLSMLEAVRAWFYERLLASGEDAFAEVACSYARSLLARFASDPEPALGEARAEIVQAVRDTLRIGAHALVIDLLDLLNRASAYSALRSLAPLLVGSLDSLQGPLEGRASLALGRALRHAGSHLESVRVLKAALPKLSGDERASALTTLAWAHLLLGEADLAAEACEEARDVDASPRVAAEIDILDSRRASDYGDLALAAAHARSAFERFVQAKMPLAAAGARYDLGNVLRMRGDVESARAAFDAVLRALRELGEDSHALQIAYCEASLSFLDEDIAARARCCERMIELLRRLGQTAELARWLSNLGASRMLLGEHEAARDALTEAKNLAKELSLPGALAAIRAHIGQLLLREGHLVEAERELQEACTLFESTGSSPARIDALCSLAIVSSRLGKPQEGERALSRAASLGDLLSLRPDSELSRAIERAIIELRTPRE